MVKTMLRLAGLFVSMLSLAPDAALAGVHFSEAIGRDRNDRLLDVRATADGGVIAVGTTEHLLLAWPGPGVRWQTDGLAVKLDAAGNVTWRRRYGNRLSDGFSSVVETDDGYAAVGFTTVDNGERNGWIVKLDRAGNLVNDRAFLFLDRDAVDRLNHIERVGDGFVVVGRTESPAGGRRDAWAMKLDRDLGTDWERAFGDRSERREPNETEYELLGASFFALRYVFVGTVRGRDAKTDAYVVRIDELGNVREQRIGGAEDDALSSVVRTDDGGFIATGFTDSFRFGKRDLWVVKLDMEGNVSWQRRYHRSSFDFGSSILQVPFPGRGYLIAGETRAGATGGPFDQQTVGDVGEPDGDAWLLRLDADGHLLWARTYGGPQPDGFRSVALTSDGDVAAAGFTASFGGGLDDGFLVRAAPNGEVEECMGAYAPAVEEYGYAAALAESHILPGPSHSAWRVTQQLDTDAEPRPACAAGLADLTGHFGIVNRTGSTLHAEVFVDNIGARASGPFANQVFLSYDRVLDDLDRPILAFSSFGLFPGGSLGPMMVDFTDPLVPGYRFLLIRADSDAWVTESDEANNVVAVPLPLALLWRASYESLPPEWAPGEEQTTFARATLDEYALRDVLVQTPLEGSYGAGYPPLTIDLPMPDGSYARFAVEESPILDPAALYRIPEASYLEYKTYRGYGLDDGGAMMRMSVSRLGLDALVVDSSGAIRVRRSRPAEPLGNSYVSYPLRGAPPEVGPDDLVDPVWRRFPPEQQNGCPRVDFRPDEVCQVADFLAAGVGYRFTSADTFGGRRAVYRTVLFVTHEYKAAFGGGFWDVLLALKTAIDQMNATSLIFERDVNVRLKIVALLGIDPPNTGWLDRHLFDKISTEADLALGHDNYDLSYVVTMDGMGADPEICTMNLGLADPSSACADCQHPAAGTMGFGRTTPRSDAYWKVMTHEIGHTLFAHHVFTACKRNTGVDLFETDAGTTLMGYGGTFCAPNGEMNLYFHGASIERMSRFVENESCIQREEPSIVPPLVSTRPTVMVPVDTPFRLMGAAAVGSGLAPTYCWEEMDTNRLFRSFPPTTNPIRTFPELAAVLGKKPRDRESLPLIGTDTRFRITVRDGAGGVSFTSAVVQVRGTQGLAVTAPAAGDSVTAGSTIEVKWTSPTPGFFGKDVNLKLSVDGGKTWTTLVASSRDDGSEMVRIAAAPAAEAFLMVESVDWSYFNVSGAFAIVP